MIHQIPYCFESDDDRCDFTDRYLIFCSLLSMPYRKKVLTLTAGLGKPKRPMKERPNLSQWSTVHGIFVLYDHRGFSFMCDALPSLQQALDSLSFVYEAVRPHLPERE